MVPAFVDLSHKCYGDNKGVREAGNWKLKIDSIGDWFQIKIDSSNQAFHLSCGTLE